ncbi:MAG: glycosyltransferase family 39 protein, partial [Aquisalimonadaceae bacterium]
MSAFISDILGHRSELRRLLEDERTHLPLLLLFALLLFCAGLGLRDPWPADEPRFALIARDMVLRGDWLIPHVGGVPYSDKPPLFMWIVACFYWLSGHLRIAFLLPSMLAGLGMLVLVYDLARRLWNPQVAFHAGLLLLLTIQFTLQARTAQLDGLLSFWVTLAIYGLLRHILLGPHWAWYYIAWFAMGLGIITKGVGFLPVLLLFPWIVLRLKWPHHLASREGQPWRLALGPVAMLFAIGLWLIPLLVYVSLENSAGLAAYRDDILFRQTAERYLDSWDHIEPFWYYVVEVIPWAWLPVSLALPWLITRWWRRMAEGDAVTWLLVGWVVCVIVFFSFSPGKRGVYLLPAVPALVLAAAPYLSELSRHRGVHLLSLLLVAAVAT